MIEMLNELCKGIAYFSKTDEKIKERLQRLTGRVDLQVTNIENEGNKMVVSFRYSRKIEIEDKKMWEIEEISCRCGKAKIRPKTKLRMPSANWEELVGFWSCHNMEFKTLTKRNLRPRKGGILYSHLYFIVRPEDFPIDKCCGSGEMYGEKYRKIFYNEVETDICHKEQLYTYLHDVFSEDKIFIFTVKEEIFVAKSLGCAILFDEDFYRAHKVGFYRKKCDIKQKEREDINEYYKELLAKRLVEANSGISHSRMEISYISE